MFARSISALSAQRISFVNNGWRELKETQSSNWKIPCQTVIFGSQFVAFHGVYHELLEKEAALQNVEDPHMRAELESDFGEQSASTKRCSTRCKWLLFQLVDMRAPRRTSYRLFSLSLIFSKDTVQTFISRSRRFSIVHVLESS
ncbi:hypothetical protein T09_7911 [Trichinella sp. T9]|nr:hypothetical protein T09_7911 [Trichinella sp. T9]